MPLNAIPAIPLSASNSVISTSSESLPVKSLIGSGKFHVLLPIMKQTKQSDKKFGLYAHIHDLFYMQLLYNQQY